MTIPLRCLGCLVAALLASAVVHLALAAALLWASDGQAPADPQGPRELGITLAMFAEPSPTPEPAGGPGEAPTSVPGPMSGPIPEPATEPEQLSEPIPEPTPEPEQPLDAIAAPSLQPLPEPSPQPVTEPPPEPPPLPQLAPELASEREPRILAQAPEPKPSRKTEAKPKTKPKTIPAPKAKARQVQPPSAGPATVPGPAVAAGPTSGPAKDSVRTGQAAGGAGAAAAEGQYLRGLQQAIARNRFYPPGARREDVKGVVTVAFTVQGDGRLTDIRVSKGSGHEVLDRAALETLRRLSSYRPIPPATGRTRWPVRVPIVFDLR